jgi:NAD(P)H-dependent flavin oxidoreductase YrpB (nitropropane dioxygenase family)
MSPELLTTYGEICGWTLARAHARTGDVIAIGSYLGENDSFDRSITEIAGSYADQNAEDHLALVDAIVAGTVAAQSDV